MIGVTPIIPQVRRHRMILRQALLALGAIAGGLLPSGCGDDGSRVSAPLDLTPPARIVTLAVRAASESTLTLGWMATGDDSLAGEAARYDLRMSPRTLTEAGWDSATVVPGLGAPQEPFTPESFTVRGLRSSSFYWFALRVADAAGNWSRISNILRARTRDVVLPPQRLTNDAAAELATDWSPDGERIAFLSSVDVNSGVDLMLVPATGGPTELLLGGAQRKQNARWKPSGDEILLSQVGTAHPSELWLIPRDGGESRPIPCGCPAIRGIGWSPDGSRIVFGCVFDIHVMPASGGESAPLTTGGPVQNWNPDWSPDGSRIAFVSDRGGSLDIWVLPAEGGEPVRRTNWSTRESSPRWSPDGSRIVFVSDRTGSLDLWLVSADGGEPWPVTDDPANDSAPCWSPDGRRIAFVSDRAGRQSDLWVVTLP